MTCLAIFFCLNIEYLNSLASLSLSIYVANILTYSKVFSSFLPSLLIKEKDIKSVDISSLWLSNTCIESFCIKGVDTESAYILGTYAKRVCTKGIYISNICI